VAIVFEQVSFTYNRDKDVNKTWVLNDINLTIPDQQVTAIIGQTGAGKSTLIQHLNGLLKPTKGQVHIGDLTVEATTKEKTLVALRQRVGMVFQFPENQLFANTVLEDVMYGPLNFGWSVEQAQDAAHKALTQVGLPEKYWQQSPFDLSGGQMRRVALAGVLASEPDILVLDEPAAGLDPQGQRELLELIMTLKNAGTTIVLITHQMEHVVAVADQVVVMGSGAVQNVATPSDLFQADPEWFAQFGLALPKAAQVAHRLQNGGLTFNTRPLSTAALAQVLNEWVGEHHE
jgi:energy-coupling factor transport system ATP-binding protein